MVTFTQDMPPPGGYSTISYKRNPLKSGSPAVKVLALLGTMAFGWTAYYWHKKEVLFQRIEDRCGNITLMPMLLAEHDRALLKYLRKNRDEEEKIMKDVEGWDVGKWKGLNVYQSLDENTFFMPKIEEVYAHTDLKQLKMLKFLFYQT